MNCTKCSGSKCPKHIRVIHLGASGRGDLISTMLHSSCIIVERHYSRSFCDLAVEISDGGYMAVLSAPTVKGRASVDLLHECRRLGYAGAWIIVGRGDNRHEEVEALECGASYYLGIDELTPSRLERIVRFTSRHAEEGRKLAFAAEYDSLTNVLNKRGFLSRCERIARSCGRSGESFAIVFVDLNGFKPINDKYGHKVGDDLLSIVGDRLTKCVRETDYVGRIGGDEFAILLTHIHDSTVVNRVAHKVRQVMSDPVVIYNLSISIGAAVGAAIWPLDGDTVDDVMGCADVRMYKNKQSAKGLVLMTNDRQDCKPVIANSGSNKRAV